MAPGPAFCLEDHLGPGPTTLGSARAWEAPFPLQERGPLFVEGGHGPK